MDEFNYAIRLLLRARRKRLTQEKSWKIRNTRHLEKCQIWVDCRFEWALRWTGRLSKQLGRRCRIFCVRLRQCANEEICRINLVPIRVLTQAIWSRILFSLMSYFVGRYQMCVRWSCIGCQEWVREHKGQQTAQSKMRNTNKQIRPCQDIASRLSTCWITEYHRNDEFWWGEIK